MVESTMDRPIRWTRRLVGALAGLALLAAAPATAAAQSVDSPVTIDPRAGIGFPVGDLADTHQAGFAGGLGIAYKLTPHIGVRGDFDLMVLDDESPQFGVVLAPTLTVIHYHAGLEFDFAKPEFQEFPLSFRWSLGAGGTSMSADRNFPDDVDVDFSGTYPSINTGMKIGYQVSPMMDLFLGGQMFLTFADEEEIAELVKRSGTQPFGTVWTAPVTLGVNVTFQ